VAGRRGSPTLRRRQLGHELRRMREASGATIDQVAEPLAGSASKISRIETGRSGISPREVRDIVTTYGVGGDHAGILIEMAREAKQRGWWQLYGTVLTSAYVGLEAAADETRSYEALVVPGLMQTDDYARAMICAARPDVRDEAVLHRPVGGPGVMRRQLERLAEVAALPNVTLQVLPFAAGAHGGMDGTFTILLSRGTTDQDLVFSASAAGGLFLEKDEESQPPAANSTEMIAELAKEP